MALYDPVPEDYSRVFNDISVRMFEWPWLKEQIAAARPRTLLGLRCGNGYLSEAVGNMTDRKSNRQSPDAKGAKTSSDGLFLPFATWRFPSYSRLR